MLYFNANHICHCRSVYKIDVGRAILRIVIVLPVLHEDANDLVALLLEQISGDCRVHSATQTDHYALSSVLLFHRVGIIPAAREVLGMVS